VGQTAGSKIIIQSYVVNSQQQQCCCRLANGLSLTNINRVEGLVRPLGTAHAGRRFSEERSREPKVAKEFEKRALTRWRF
jgi:hypothetical protein